MRRIVLRGSILLLLGALALAVLRHLDLNPITLGGFPQERESAGSAPGPGKRTDVVVWIDSASILESARERRFSRLDLSCAWLSLLEGRLGSVGVWDGPTPPDAATPRALVVTSSIASRIGPEVVESWLVGGATVLVDAPNSGVADARWLERAGVAPAGSHVLHPPNLAPLLDDAAAQEWANLEFTAPPVWSRYAPLDSDTAPTPSVDSPLAFTKRVGSGSLVVAAIPLARWWCRLSQGEPADDFTVSEKLGDYENIREPDDLALHASQRECEIPFSDRLADALLALLEPEDAPLPRVAWYPRGSKGVYLMTHDEDLRGGAEMAALAALDRGASVRGTHFVIGHPRLMEDWHDGHVASILGAGGEIAIHWNRFPTPHGAWKVEPVQWVATLAEQLDWLAPLPVAQPRWNRTHFLQVDGTWTSSFRALEAAGVAFDSTYAANKGRGYLFGSALPRRILDENGLPLNVREVAFHHQEDWGGADPAFFDRLFHGNAASNRGAIVSIFHPPKVLREPTPRATIDHATAVALSSGHRAFTASEYGRFVLANLELEIDSRTADREIVVDYRRAAEGSAILIPSPRAGYRVEPTELESVVEAIGGREYLRIELPTASGRIRLMRE